MKYLLDTHTFLWMIMESEKLSQKVHDIIKDSRNDLFLSVVSGWEISIKTNIGKLSIPESSEVLIPKQLLITSIRDLPIYMCHCLHIKNLPNHHKDPFDRMIISQAQVEKMIILTMDNIFKKYKVDVLW